MTSATFTPEEVEKVKELRRKGLSWQRIADAINRPFTTVYQFFGKRRPLALSQEQRQEIIEMRRQGIPWLVISERFGIDDKVLRDRVRRAKNPSEPRERRAKPQPKGEGSTRKSPRVVVHLARPTPELLAERERRYGLINRQLLTERLMGDPPSDLSALARISPERLKHIRGD